MKPPSHPENPKPPSTKKLPRRDFLKGISAAIGTAAINTLSPSIAAANTKNTPPTPDEPQTHNSNPTKPTDHETTEISPLDYLTATTTAATFVRNVFYKGIMQGINLGPKSAAEVNAAAFGRIAALYLAGNPEHQHLAKEELHEILVEGMIPLLILVPLSDMTTSELKVNTDEIFTDTENTLNSTNKIPDYRYIQRPQLSADKSEWQTHLDQTENHLRAKISQIAAVSSVLAPLGTTYTSSILANNLKSEVVHIVYEQSYAKFVLSSPPNSVIYHEEIQQKALERTEQLINGPFGFSNLQTALAANIHGSFLLGDPPEIYFAIRHKDNPELLAKSQAFGLASSELSTILLNAIWLKKADILTPNTLGTFLTDQAKVIQELTQTITKKPHISIGNVNKYLTQIENTLKRTNGQRAAELLKILQSIPKASFQFSISDYLKAKTDWNRHRKYPDLEKLSETAIASAEAFADDAGLHEYIKSIKSGNSKKSAAYLKLISDQIKSFQATQIAELFEGMLEHQTTFKSLAEIKSNPEIDENSPESIRIQNKVSEAIQISDSLFNQLKFSDDKSHPNEKELTAEQLYNHLSKWDKKTLQAALKKFTSLDQSEDAIPGRENEASTGETITEAQKHHPEHTPTALTHQAQEVLFALLTQIPAVPSFKRLAQIIIPKVAGVPANATPTLDQLKTIFLLTTIAETGKSALADNAAAYMFGEGTILSFFEKTLGNQIMKDEQSLTDLLSILSEKIAEFAGNLLKTGNGPNFSQDKLVILLDESNPQGISVDRQDYPLKETGKNGYSYLANFLMLSIANTMITKKIDNLKIKYPHLNTKKQ